MDADWITSPSARRVQQHAGDSRPAWLWSQDGQLLLWHNEAAPLFLAKLKKHGPKRADAAVPIKGQIARSIRLGSSGRTSLARIQFTAGQKPASATCATTPLPWQDGQTALLIVGVDPIDAEILDAARKEAEAAEPAPVEPDAALDTDAWEDAEIAPAPDDEAVPPSVDRVAAGAEQTAYAQELENWRAAEADSAQEAAATDAGAEPDADKIASDTGGAAPSVNRLSQLVERLAADEALFTPLTAADDEPPQAGTDAQHGPQTDAEADLPDLVALDGVPEDAPAPDNEADQSDKAEAVAELPPGSADTESVERVSRYNFDELARILSDRVGETAPARAPATASETPRSGALVNLGGETLVLNRLPLGILVFRDQQILFANRAITEMVGYESVESLRAEGLSAVFPAVGPETEEAGPVNHLVQRDGTLIPVTARLQSISWQGRPALMLSASTTEVRTGHEAAVMAFAQAFADIGGDGFLQATRAGVISTITPRSASLLGIEGAAEGMALSTLVAGSEVAALRDFLERPARFAETERPSLTLRAISGKAEIALFTQGQAGVVSGYFGLVRGQDTIPARLTAPADVDPALLARIGRGVRRPLNTIIGFADLIRSEAFGALQNERYESYAQDITTAGQEIAALVDELEDYARLRDGRYLPQRASIDLTELLESCVRRIRVQASGARVIVRNAISQSLPRVTADRASLEQAVLNLLASAIDQTPIGGGVVISAQREDDGGVAIHVRDSSNNAVDMAERFVVFRDGPGRDGRALVPVRSSIGLALTRSLLAVNAFSLSVDPAGEQGMLFTLVIPAELVDANGTASVAE
jgi:signal transduction histidine kinase/PAS domain-containing protein